MMDASSFEDLQSKVFTLPGWLLLSLISALNIAVASLVSGRILEVLRIFFTPVLLFQALRPIKRGLNLKRSFVLSNFVLFMSLPSLRLKPESAGATVTPMLTVITYFTTRASEPESAAISFITALLLAQGVTVSYIFKSLMGVLLGIIFISYLNRDVGFNVKRILKGFLLVWLNGDPDYLQKELKGIGEYFDGWTKCLRIEDVSLISMSFHPGPIRRVGGSKLVERVMSRFGNAIYLHTAVDHSLNPVDDESVDRIVSSIKCSCVEGLRPEKPFDLEGDYYTLRVFPFGDYKVMFLIGKRASDDLPYELNEYAGKNCILVETHSAYDRNFRATDEITREVAELIRKAKSVRTEPRRLRYGFKMRRTSKGNICGYICGLLLDYGDERHVILMIDGNNVLLEFRKEIERVLEAKGYKATVISTDNHSKTGYGKVGYKPIGSDEEDRREVFSFIDELLGVKLKDCKKICYGYSNVRAKVMGESFFTSAERVVKELAGKSLKLFFAVQIAQVLISLI